MAVSSKTRCECGLLGQGSSARPNQSVSSARFTNSVILDKSSPLFTLMFAQPLLREMVHRCSKSWEFTSAKYPENLHKASKKEFIIHHVCVTPHIKKVIKKAQIF